MLPREVMTLVRYVYTHPANRRGAVSALGRLLGWQLYKRLVRRPFNLRLSETLKIRCYPDSTIASQLIYCRGLPDYHEMLFVQDYLRRGDGFIDVGANIGSYALLAASVVGDSGHVEAFEPGPVAVGRLQENVALNQFSAVTVHQLAVSADSGVVPILSQRDVLNRILASADRGATTVQARCVRLDEFLAGQRFALGKMDVEGAEPLALQGAERMLADRNPPAWLLEVNGKLRDYGFSENWLAEWLAVRGYELALYDAEAGELVRQTEPWRMRDNVLAVAAGQWAAVSRRAAEGRVARLGRAGGGSRGS
jgi:FkbM family methyltransferase